MMPELSHSPAAPASMSTASVGFAIVGSRTTERLMFATRSVAPVKVFTRDRARVPGVDQRQVLPGAATKGRDLPHVAIFDVQGPLRPTDAVEACAVLFTREVDRVLEAEFSALEQTARAEATEAKEAVLVYLVNRHTNFLHDGRARTVEEAILWHGGEAERSREAYKSLDKAERRQLLVFLKSL